MGVPCGLPVLLGALAVIDLLREAGGFGFASIALGRPIGVVGLRVRLVIVAPILVRRLGLGPLRALGLDPVSPRRPMSLSHGLALLALRGFVDRLGAD